MDTYGQQQAIRAYIVRAVTLIADNDARLYHRLTEAAQRAVLEDMGQPAPTVDDYRETYEGRGGMYERSDYADVIGSRVCDELLEIISEAVPDDDNPARLLLVDLLDLNDSEQKRMFGEHYMPDPDDIEPEDEDED